MKCPFCFIGDPEWQGTIYGSEPEIIKRYKCKLCGKEFEE